MLIKSRNKESSSSFGLDVNVDILTSLRYKYAGNDGRTLTKGLIGAGMVDAYRYMSFYYTGADTGLPLQSSFNHAFRRDEPACSPLLGVVKVVQADILPLFTL